MQSKMSSSGDLFDCSDARLQDTEAQGELSDKFWHYFKNVDNCLAEHRRRSDHANNDRRVKIAVLDSGIDMNHPRIQDLIQKTSEWNQDRLVSKSFVGLDDNLDPVGHGTHIGGTIMSIAQGAKLYMGGVVERNKRVNTEALAEAIQYAVEKWEVDIISLSLGFPKRPTKALTKAINEALHREKLIFAAVSNNGGASPTGISWPAMETKVFGVFSANFDGERSQFNPDENDDDTFSRYKFLGEAVKSAWLEGKEKRMTGTSVATSIAASTAALFIEYIRGNIQGDKEVTSAAMIAIERCARMPDGMRRIFAEAGRRREANDFLKYVTPWYLLDYEKRRFIIHRIDQSLFDLQLDNYHDEFQSLQEANTAVRDSVSDQRKQLGENRKSFEDAKYAIQTQVLSILGVTAFGSGSLNLAFPTAFWVTSTIALGTVWILLSSARERQGKALIDYRQQAIALLPGIQETIRLSSINISQGDKAMRELLSLVERIIEYYGESASDSQVPKAELDHLEATLEQLKLHIIQQTEFQRTEPISRDPRVQSLINELGESVCAHKDTAEELPEREQEHHKQLRKAKEVLDQAIRVAETIQDAPREINKIKKERDAQEEKARADLAEKEEKENGNTVQWLHWFLLWLGVGGAVIFAIMAAFAA